VIPTLLLPGLIAGFLPKGWIFVIVAALGWPILLVATGVDSGWAFFLDAGALAAANAAVAWSVGLAIRFVVGQRRR